jgi:phosphoribosyl 1,2-cyclic phosphodiesterase
MLIKFWGVHGSIPRPGPKTIRYGGNTPCVEVRCPGTLIILDAGTGIRELGEDLVRRYTDASGERRKIKGHIFISHLHWDHVQGFPFFSPAFIPHNEFHVYGVKDIETNVLRSMRNQMCEPNFPITLDEMEADVDFHDIAPGDRLTVDETTIRIERLNHPGDSYAFGLECAGKSMVYASDTEHSDTVDPVLLEMSRDADLLIYDGMYDADQYLGLWDGQSRESWGHSTWKAGTELASAANVKELILFHHGNEDRIVEMIEKKAQAEFPATRAAYEGMEIDLSE